MTKWIVTTLFLLLGLLQTRLWGNENGIRDVLRLKQIIDQQQNETLRLKKRNLALEQEVNTLKNFPESLEERARSELGMVKQNETFYLISEEK